MSDPERSRTARRLAERALVRLVREYGKVPEFVLLGGLVPDLLCSGAVDRHVDTTDVDVQVDLEIQGGSVNGARLEASLRRAGFRPDSQRVWRWRDEAAAGMVVKRSSSSPTRTTSPTKRLSRSSNVNLLGRSICAAPGLQRKTGM